MSNKKNNKVISATRDSQSYAAADIITQLHTTEASMELQPALDASQRHSLCIVAGKMPTSVIETVSSIASQGDGTVLGLPFDADAARQQIAYAAAYQPVIVALRGFAQDLEDDITQRQVPIVDKVRAVIAVMGRSMRTEEGKALGAQYKSVKADLRAANGRQKVAKKVDPTADASAPPAGSAASTASATPLTLVVPVTAKVTDAGGSNKAA